MDCYKGVVELCRQAFSVFDTARRRFITGSNTIGNVSVEVTLSHMFAYRLLY